MYGLRKDLSKSPSPPPADKVADEGVQPREVVVDLAVGQVQPTDVKND